MEAAQRRLKSDVRSLKSQKLNSTAKQLNF